MFLVKFLRWIYGYFEFCINGRFPERFLNLAARNGLVIWDSSGTKETLRAKARSSDKNNIYLFAQKSENNVTIIKNYGLPYLCSIYKNRAGLFCGMILGCILCCYLSGYIWTIKINSPEGINSYEIREELRQLGFYEGIRFSQKEVNRVEHSIKIQDKRISWLNINIFGTNAVVEISATSGKVKTAEENKNIGNLKSTADGTITKINVRKGNSTVHVGDGITKGQLLVSGTTEYSDGTTLISDSDGEIYAKTSRTVVLHMNKTYDKIKFTENSLSKKEINFFGISIPITFCGNPENNYCKTVIRQRAVFLQQELPITVTEEKWLHYNIIPTNISKEFAKQQLQKRLQLYEVFLLCSNDKTILAKNISFDENKNDYVLTANYIIEENVCEKSYVRIKES